MLTKHTRASVLSPNPPGGLSARERAYGQPTAYGHESEYIIFEIIFEITRARTMHHVMSARAQLKHVSTLIQLSVD